MEYMYEILITILIIFFVSTFVLSRLYVGKEKRKERLLLIEKGFDISNLPLNGKFKNSFPWLKLGIVIIGASTGFLVGLVIYSIKLIPGPPPGALGFLFSFLFAGVGMIIAHYADKPKEQN